jgi:hypothetical protein
MADSAGRVRLHPGGWGSLLAADREREAEREIDADREALLD